jgi:hypothetical protein
LTSITRTLAADLNHHFAARTTEAIVQDAVAWVIERVETRKDEAVKALREGRDPGDLDYDL